MRHMFRWIALFCLVSLLLSACSLTKTPAAPLRFGPNPTWVGHAPFFTAAERHLYGSTQVETVTFGSLYDAYRAFTQRRVDAIGTTLFDALRMADEGIPAKVVMVMDYSNGADGIVARGGINSVRDLKGKRVGVAVGDLNHFVLLAALDQAGLKETDVELVNMPVEESAKAFAEGKLDAATLWEPLLSEQASAAGAKKIFTSAEIPGRVVDVVVVQKDIAEQRPEDVANLVMGWENAMRLWKNQPQEAEGVMAQAMHMTVDEFKANIGGLEFVDLTANHQLFDPADQHSIWKTYNAAADFMYQHQLLKKPAPNAHEIIDSGFLGATALK